MPTFQDLGLDISLFAADVAEASSWSADGICAICNEPGPGFTLGAGDDLIVECSTCEASTSMPCDGATDECQSCGSRAAAPDLRGRHACVRCLRAHAWASTQDSEAGMIRWRDAIQGRTFGVPFDEPQAWSVGLDGAEAADTVVTPLLAGFPTTEPNQDGWRSAIVPVDDLLDLVATPSFATNQGAYWLFHCRKPMRYLGRWGRADFDSIAPDRDGRAVALEIADLDPNAWDHGMEDAAGDCRVGVYAFRCVECGAHRANWDYD